MGTPLPPRERDRMSDVKRHQKGLPVPANPTRSVQAEDKQKTGPQTSDWLQQQIDQFEKVRSRYETLTLFLQEEIEEALSRLGIKAEIRGRTKDLPSFAEKIV